MKKTEHLQLTSAQLASPNGRPHATGHMVSQPTLRASDTDLTEPRGTSIFTAEAELATLGNRGVRQLEPAPEPPPGPYLTPANREPSACLRNKPAAVHRERGRGPRREPAQRALTQIPQYRLDSAVRRSQRAWSATFPNGRKVWARGNLGRLQWRGRRGR